MQSSFQRRHNCQSFQQPNDSSTSKLSFTSEPFHSKVSSIYQSILDLAIIHLLYFFTYTFFYPIHRFLLLSGTMTVFWLAMSTNLNTKFHQNKRLKVFIVYPLTSSLSKTFTIFMPNKEDFMSVKDPVSVLVSALLSGLTLLLFIWLKFTYTNPKENVYQKVKELEEERDRAHQKAEDQDFIGTLLSHESRNILNCLINSLNFLEMDLSSAFDLEKAQEDLLGAKYCSVTLLNYFNNYLENRKSIHTQERTKSNLLEILPRVQEIIKSAIEFKKLKAKFIIERNTPKNLLVNESSLTQIILNLIYNSIKFTEKGSVDVKVSWKDHKSQSSCSNASTEASNPEESLSPLPSFPSKPNAPIFSNQPQGSTLARMPKLRTFQEIQTGLLQRGKLIVEVTDTGCGMNEEETKKLFQQFSQTNMDPEKRRQGSGLGLWLTKTIVEKLGGHVHVESQIGKGSTFKVIIECQEFMEGGRLDAEKEVIINPMISSSRDAKMKITRGIMLGTYPFEDFVVRTFMKNCGIENIKEVGNLDELWKELKTCIEENALVILDERYVNGLNELYKQDQSVLRRKLIVSLGDDGKLASKSQCVIEGSKRLERPVQWDDFSELFPEKLNTSMSRSFS